MAAPALLLSPAEAAICGVLDRTCRWIEREHPRLPAEFGPTAALERAGWRCEARIAGGWVRDKLLGLPSDDLDVCLSNLTGHQFAQYVRLHLSHADDGHSQRTHTTPPSSAPQTPADGPLPAETLDAQPAAHAPTLGTITKIAANPLLGKNLETATAKLLGQSVDFVQLRGPAAPRSGQEAVFGTPRQDAERRDLTINSLFFNVHTLRVEDMTGLGLADLRDGCIRTPLPPSETFADDPLRILRSIRFACRFGFALHDDVRTAVAGPGARAAELRSALADRISRERFGAEVDKMFRSRHPALALQTIHDLGLFPLVFRPPWTDGQPSVLYTGEGEPPAPAQPACADEVAVTLGRRLELLWRASASAPASASASTPVSVSTPASGSAPVSGSAPASVCHPASEAWLAILADAEQRRRLFYAVAVFPLRGRRAMSHPLPSKAGQKPRRSMQPAGDVVLVDGLRTGVRATKDPVEALYQSVQALLKFGTGSVSVSDDGPGHADAHLRLWFLLRRPYFSRSAMGITPASAFLFASLVHDHVGLQQADLDRWWGWVEERNMAARAEERPLLNGRQLQDLVGFSPGPLIPRMQEKLLEWQFDNGEQPRAEELAAEWFAQAWADGQILPSDEIQRAREAAMSKAKGKKRPRS